MSLLRATFWVFRKDVRIEMRTGEILITTGFFDRTRQWQLWLQVAITEHCVLMMRVVIGT